MLKRSRVLMLGAFVSAIAAGTFFSPEPTCATTGGCPIPTLMVSNYLGTTGSSIQSNLSPNLKRCSEQCDELLNGCQGVAAAAEKCALESFGADSAADERGCNDLSKPASGECKQSARSNLNDFTDFIKQDKANALVNCQNAHDSCLSNCGQSED
jgi:hypothetical protein